MNSSSYLNARRASFHDLPGVMSIAPAPSSPTSGVPRDAGELHPHP